VRLPLALLAFGALLGAGCGAADAADDDPLLVAAAADLRPAFTLLGEEFEATTGTPVTFSFGSSGQLAQQIIEGAPMDVFASADAGFVDAVLDAGRGDPDARATYAYGRIVVWSQTDTRWDDVGVLAADPGVTTIAIANPEHAPYGRAAQQALTYTGTWDAVAPRLVYGENVADTQRLAATGNADAAIIALSLALASDEAGEGTWSLIPDDLHSALQQDLVIVAADPDRADLARRFVDTVMSPAGRDVMRRFGFLLPGEDPPASWAE
jgi:molybdate transport system substrate-binding protein